MVLGRSLRCTRVFPHTRLLTQSRLRGVGARSFYGWPQFAHCLRSLFLPSLFANAEFLITRGSRRSRPRRARVTQGAADSESPMSGKIDCGGPSQKSDAHWHQGPGSLNRHLSALAIILLTPHTPPPLSHPPLSPLQLLTMRSIHSVPA